MSYDVRLKDPETGERIILNKPHQVKGGTYAVGGTDEAWLNITYNYAVILGKVLDGGIRGLYGKTVQESIPILEKAIKKLKDNNLIIKDKTGGYVIDDDYWKATEGNVKIALKGLLELAKMSPPSAVWDGD